METHMSDSISSAQIKAGEVAIAYCIKHRLAAWYVVTNGPRERCLIMGPYNTFEAANKECFDSAHAEFLTSEEAKEMIC